MKKKILSMMLSMVFAVSIAATAGFNTKVAKANDSHTYEYNNILVGTKNLNNTIENSAKLGDVLSEPEKGWKRFEDTNRNLEHYENEWLRPTRTTCIDKAFNGTTEDVKKSRILRFKFKGTKFRIINYNDYHWAGGKLKITIDGKEDSSTLKLFTFYKI